MRGPRRVLGHVLALTIVPVMLAGCASAPRTPLRTPAHVDLARYMGTWHVIANIPNMFERGKVATADEYHLRRDGGIDVTYHYRDGFGADPQTWHGRAWLPHREVAARWKVRLLWPFTSDYVIMALDPHYRYVMVGLPSRKLLWLMARGTGMPDEVYRRYVAQARAEGFPVEQLRRVPQRRAQLGQRGFQ